MKTTPGGIQPKAHIPLEMGFGLATQRKWNLHQKNEMYMANARNLPLGPNTTYIPLTGVGGCVGSNTNYSRRQGLRWLQDTNMLVSPTQNSGVGGTAQRQPPTPGILRRSGI